VSRRDGYLSYVSTRDSKVQKTTLLKVDSQRARSCSSCLLTVVQCDTQCRFTAQTWSNTVTEWKSYWHYITGRDAPDKQIQLPNNRLHFLPHPDHPDGKAYGGTGILIRERIKHHFHQRLITCRPRLSKCSHVTETCPKPHLRPASL